VEQVDDREREHHREAGVAVLAPADQATHARRADQGIERRREGGLGHDPEPDARDRDPELASGEVDLELFGHPPRTPEAAVVLELRLVELPDAGHGELDRHEVAVREQEGDAAEQPEHHGELCHLPSVLGRRW